MKRKTMYHWFLKGTQTIATANGSRIEPFIHTMWTNTDQERKMKRLINWEIQKFLNETVLKIQINDQRITDKTEVVLG